eukprot:CAMPEP_0184036538 /NCGR_PEP_ID=MMETSP0955-20130417/32976_1 /TAXON_ID=627963 /ORGANISM="Aplanochytrium sp, Strain PBS07" /LENGTH=289 /DNA_ID=CAMNT_0026324221 /DNA_START=158 /DNA_END=1027 /DNA_ORIENTATION=+
MAKRDSLDDLGLGLTPEAPPPPAVHEPQKKRKRVKTLNGRYGRTQGLFLRKADGDFSLLPMPVCSAKGACDLDCCKDGSELQDPAYIEKLRNKARQIHEMDKGTQALDSFFQSCLRIRSSSETQGNAFAHLTTLASNKKVRCSYCRTLQNLPPDLKPHNFGSGCPNYLKGKREIGRKLPYFVEYVLPAKLNSRSRLRVTKSYFQKLFVIGHSKMAKLLKSLSSDIPPGKRRKKGESVEEELPPPSKEDEISQSLRATIARQKAKIANQTIEIKRLKETIAGLMKDIKGP